MKRLLLLLLLSTTMICRGVTTDCPVGPPSEPEPEPVGGLLVPQRMHYKWIVFAVCVVISLKSYAWIIDVVKDG